MSVSVEAASIAESLVKYIQYYPQALVTSHLLVMLLLPWK